MVILKIKRVAQRSRANYRLPFSSLVTPSSETMRKVPFPCEIHSKSKPKFDAFECHCDNDQHYTSDIRTERNDLNHSKNIQPTTVPALRAISLPIITLYNRSPLNHITIKTKLHTPSLWERSHRLSRMSNHESAVVALQIRYVNTSRRNCTLRPTVLYACTSVINSPAISSPCEGPGVRMTWTTAEALTKATLTRRTVKDLHSPSPYCLKPYHSPVNLRQSGWYSTLFQSTTPLKRVSPFFHSCPHPFWWFLHFPSPSYDLL